jgi:hypothetical protein
MSCDGWSNAESVLDVRVPPGPGGRYFAGVQIAAWASLSTEILAPGDEQIPPSMVTIALEPFVPLELGRVRGAVAIDAMVRDPDAIPPFVRALDVRGGGSFDVRICPDRFDAFDRPAPPERATDAPLEGTLGGRAVRVRSAIARLRAHPAEGYVEIERIALFDLAHVDCTMDVDWRALAYVAPAGADSLHDATAAPLPAVLSLGPRAWRRGWSCPTVRSSPGRRSEAPSTPPLRTRTIPASSTGRSKRSCAPDRAANARVSRRRDARPRARSLVDVTRSPYFSR